MWRGMIKSGLLAVTISLYGLGFAQAPLPVAPSSQAMTKAAVKSSVLPKQKLTAITKKTGKKITFPDQVSGKPLSKTKPPVVLTTPTPPLGDSPAAAAMWIRTVPLVVTGYAEGDALKTQNKTPDATLALLTPETPLLVQMETLREAYGNYGKSDLVARAALLKQLKDRYMLDPNNAQNYFDYGYAQLVMDGDKNGLFFLRKANDQLASPATSIAYALGEADADWLMEKAAPDDLTTRKMDVMYKLKDALMLNRQAQLTGVWPTYLNILAALKTAHAYDTLGQEDVTTLYIPYGPGPTAEKAGSSTAPAVPVDTANNSASATASATTLVPDVVQTCHFDSPFAPSLIKFSKTADLNHTGHADSINFYTQQATAKGPYAVQVLDEHNKVIGEFQSMAAPYLAEDINGDQHYELVVRQYDKNPLHPLAVYRWNGQCFGEDQSVTRLFR